MIVVNLGSAVGASQPCRPCRPLPLGFWCRLKAWLFRSPVCPYVKPAALAPSAAKPATVYTQRAYEQLLPGSNAVPSPFATNTVLNVNPSSPSILPQMSQTVSSMDSFPPQAPEVFVADIARVVPSVTAPSPVLPESVMAPVVEAPRFSPMDLVSTPFSLTTNPSVSISPLTATTFSPSVVAPEEVSVSANPAMPDAVSNYNAVSTTPIVVPQPPSSIQAVVVDAPIVTEEERPLPGLFFPSGFQLTPNVTSVFTDPSVGVDLPQDPMPNKPDFFPVDESPVISPVTMPSVSIPLPTAFEPPIQPAPSPFFPTVSEPEPVTVSTLPAAWSEIVPTAFEPPIQPAPSPFFPTVSEPEPVVVPSAMAPSASVATPETSTPIAPTTPVVAPLPSAFTNTSRNSMSSILFGAAGIRMTRGRR